MLDIRANLTSHDYLLGANFDAMKVREARLLECEEQVAVATAGINDGRGLVFGKKPIRSTPNSPCSTDARASC